MVFVITTSSFYQASFFGVVALSVDRFLSNSSSSQISGTCDSQACCCCGDLNMAFQCISFVEDGLDSALGQYFSTC